MKRWSFQRVTLGLFLAAALSTVRVAAAPTTHIGALEYVEGKVFVNGEAVQGNKEKLPILDEGSLLSTAKGHAEMLLTPGVFLRLADGSEARLAASSLTDTRIQLDRGAAILEVDDLHKDNLLRVQVGDATARVLKTGLYRFETEPATVEVLNGKVETMEGDRSVKAGAHHKVTSPDLMVSKFKASDDGLDRWSRLRSEYEAEASVASAQYIYDTGMPWGYSDWFWNPWFGTWTWLPASGFWMNPYGFGYWSPFLVYDYYPLRYYGPRHYIFTPRAGIVSPSGLNLQRGPQARSPRGEMFAGRGVSAWPRAYGGAPVGRSFSMGGHFGGGGFHGGRR